ncbi:LytR/AlgR family response regulator transcription factor [Aquimarina sp. W85]|uniref:LytR/AlgR family response regulator transcription factor n=1 Tax=Aquimarina rhodophyticola TaxID=3342246 RepID=UPI003671D823
MKILIIEDERPAARRLSRMLETLGFKPETMLHSVTDSIQWFSTHPHPDLIFLDIQLSDGLSFEIFDAISVTSAIIFTTAYDEYALKAFKLNSIDYLMKPIEANELETAIQKFKKHFVSNEIQPFDVNTIKKLLQTTPEYKKRYPVRIGQHIKIIEISEISCFYSENKGTYIHTLEDRSYVLDTTLDLLENELDPRTFYRVSRKYIININAIEDIISYTNSRLQLKLKATANHQIIVSRERVKDFKEWLE